MDKRGIFVCQKIQPLDTKCAGRAVGMVKDGKLLCQDPASIPPGYDYHREQAGPNSYRFVSNQYCPKGFRFGKAWINQTVCVGPDAFDCGEGYAGVELDGPRAFCGAQVPARDWACKAGGRPNTKDALGRWYCVEPDSDKCPKEGRHYRIGLPAGEKRFRCLFVTQ